MPDPAPACSLSTPPHLHITPHMHLPLTSSSSSSFPRNPTPIPTSNIRHQTSNLRTPHSTAISDPLSYSHVPHPIHIGPATCTHSHEQNPTVLRCARHPPQYLSASNLRSADLAVDLRYLLLFPALVSC